MRDYFDAQDLSQDTFLSIYKHLSGFDRQYEKAWVCQIATNKCLDYLKRASRQNIPMDDEYLMAQRDKAPTPEESILELEAKKQILERCSNLKTPYKEIAMDYFYNELSAADIATKGNKNLKTVQTQIYRARAMLQKNIGKELKNEQSRNYQ